MNKPRGARSLAGSVGSFVKGRPRAQKVTTLGAVALLVTAPFGGLKQVESPPPESAQVREPFRVGPYDVTVRRARTLPTLEPAYEPAEGNQLLVFVVEVENLTDRSEFVHTFKTVLSVDDGDVLEEDGQQLQPEIRHLEDGETIPYLNPDVPVELALIYEQPLGWDGREVSLGFQEMVLQEVDPFTLDPDAWLVSDGPPAVEVRVPVTPAEDAVPEGAR